MMKEIFINKNSLLPVSQSNEVKFKYTDVYYKRQ